MKPWFPLRLGGFLRTTRVFDEITVKTVVLTLNSALVSGAYVPLRGRVVLFSSNEYVQILPCASSTQLYMTAPWLLTKFGTEV